MHLREVIIRAFVTALKNHPGLDGVYHDLDPQYDIPAGFYQAVSVYQGVESVLQNLNKYDDALLNVTISLRAKENPDSEDTATTILNELELQVCQALRSHTNSGLGVPEASNLRQTGTGEPSPESGNVPASFMATQWTIQYRRDADDPQQITP